MHDLIAPRHRRWLTPLVLVVLVGQSVSLFQPPRLMTDAEWAAYDTVRRRVEGSLRSRIRRR